MSNKTSSIAEQLHGEGVSIARYGSETEIHYLKR